MHSPITVRRVRCLAILLASIALAQPSKDKEPDLGGVTETHLMVPMRDGAKLSVYLYTPPGKGPWPVLYEQRYASLRGASTRQRYAKLAAQGYIVAAENFRGTQLSGGTYVGYRALGWGEQKDGYDTVEWLAKQPWSTGKIGTFGGSQAGYAQNFLAVTQPPHLVAQFITDGGLSLFHLGYRIGGITRGKRYEQMYDVCREPNDGRMDLLRQLEHPTYDVYWQQEDCRRHFDKMNVPCFTVASWYDFMSVGSIETFLGREHHGGPRSRGAQKLVIGPWLHGGTKTTTQIAEMEYPKNSFFDVDAHMVRWFDHYLKGKDTGIEKDPPVRYYVLGVNEWRTAKDWPVPGKDAVYYLRESELTQTKPISASGETEFKADPANPAPMPGRNYLSARDGREWEKHPDVRSFTTQPLAKAVEWTGKVSAELFVSSNVPDTDFILRVSDVYPDGRSIMLIESIRRARFREGFEKMVFMKPGEVYKIAFDIGHLSQVFAPGHRIRVSVGGTGSDFYEPNTNTEDNPTIGPPSKTAIAANKLQHNRIHASRIIVGHTARLPGN
ncbi:MAG: CocE/NonD family hydrolase [Bryobacteraceae bacterium]